MTEESKKDSIRNSTLHTLIKHNGLTPQEVALLRLSDLHLAGKSPNIKFTPPDSDEPKTIELDLDAHRALVGWLVARPDSTSDYLFPGQGAEPMTGPQIEQLVAVVDQPPETPAKPKPPVMGQAAAAASAAPRTGAPPPRSAPELGAPPPGMTPLGTTFTPPPTAPESGEPVNMPLPSSAPPPRPPESDQPARKPASAPVTPAAAGVAATAAKESAKPDAVKPGTTSSTGTPAQIKAKQTSAKQSNKGPRIAIVATAIVLVLLCAGCLAGGWFASQSETGGQLLARLGIAGTVMPLDDADIMASLTPPPTNTPQPTPTLPPTSTPTSSTTDTPVPTDTPIPSDTPVPPPTDTPLPAETPTDTPVPDTPTPEVPAETPTPEAPPTPAMKYPAPTLLEPEDGTHFIIGNIIVLSWQPVGELASDEQYAVRLVYQFESQPTYQGTNLRETGWEVPPSLYGQIDGPDNLYEWFVVVERLNDDGSGTAISPESEHRNFTWK